MDILNIILSGILTACCLLTGFLVHLFIRKKRGKPKVSEEKKEVPVEQSGAWVYCGYHGNVPISKKEHKKQTEAGMCRCPHCGKIPKRIWFTSDTKSNK